MADLTIQSVTCPQMAARIQKELDAIGAGFIVTSRKCGTHFPFYAIGVDDTVRRTRHAAKCDKDDCSDVFDPIINWAEEIRSGVPLPSNMVY